MAAEFDGAGLVGKLRIQLDVMCRCWRGKAKGAGVPDLWRTLLATDDVPETSSSTALLVWVRYRGVRACLTGGQGFKAVSWREKAT